MPRVAALLSLGIALASAAGAADATSARADVTHIVQRGHTLEAIAHRYHVTEKAIIEANHLKDPQHLRVGEQLVIPGVAPGPGRAAAAMGAAGPHGRFERDVVHAVRLGQQVRVRVKDGRGRIPPSALAAFTRLMRQGDATHPPDPRLVALVGIVSNHFGGRTIEVVSGYRPYKPTQYTPDSRHNYGRALDFRIRGVPNETLWAFCRTLRNAGCGYYPNSSFVHMDVRDAKTFWIDRARPGEPPRYDTPGTAADEGTSDVPGNGTR